MTEGNERSRMCKERGRKYLKAAVADASEDGMRSGAIEANGQEEGGETRSREWRKESSVGKRPVDEKEYKSPWAKWLQAHTRLRQLCCT